jgi:broad specificity phosphatase PhoE
MIRLNFTPPDPVKNAMAPGRLVLVKHARPVLDPARPPHQWILGADGEAQAADLAPSLRGFLPFDLVASPEPKALKTAQVVAARLGAEARAVDGLQEFDRPALPLMSAREHARVNSRIFAEPNRPMLGSESARGALARFSAALLREVSARKTPNLVAVSHGTVISLFVARHNAIDAFGFWRSLECGAFAVLDLPSLRLLPARAPAAGA